MIKWLKIKSVYIRRFFTVSAQIKSNIPRVILCRKMRKYPETRLAVDWDKTKTLIDECVRNLP